jgi:hypothetical protein
MSLLYRIQQPLIEPITNTAWLRARICKLKKKGAAESVNGYQLLANGQWFPPGTLASSTNKTDRHDIAEIFLKVALSKLNQSNH